MQGSTDIASQLPAYKGDHKVLVSNQDFKDIMIGLLKEHDVSARDYDKISEKFWAGSGSATCRNIFDYCKRNMDYSEESAASQTVRTPSAILAEGKSIGVDCKHYSSFICGVIDSLRRKGYPVVCFYRFVAYPTVNRPGNRDPGHVFAVAICDKRQIFVDPVLDALDQRTPRYNFHIDKFPGMALKRVSGHGDFWGGHFLDTHPHHAVHAHHPHAMPAANTAIPLYGNGLISRTGHPLVAVGDVANWQTGEHGQPFMATVGKKKKGTKKKHHGLHLKIKLPHIKIQPGKILLKVAMAPSRNAFLLLLKKNVFGLAADLHNKAYAHGKGGNIDKIWKKIGGNTNKLHTAINQGVKNYNAHHANRKITGYTVGVVPAIAAAIVAATPVIVKLTELLKSFGIDPAKLTKGNADAKADMVDHHNKSGHKANHDGSVDHDDPDGDPDDPVFQTKVVKDSTGHHVEIGVKPGTGKGDSFEDTSGDEDGDGDGDEDGGPSDSDVPGGHHLDKKEKHKEKVDGDDDNPLTGIEDWVGDNKGKLIAGAGVLVGGSLLLSGMQGPKKSKSSKMLAGALIGVGGIAYYKFTDK